MNRRHSQSEHFIFRGKEREQKNKQCTGEETKGRVFVLFLINLGYYSFKMRLIYIKHIFSSSTWWLLSLLTYIQRWFIPSWLTFPCQYKCKDHVRSSETITASLKQEWHKEGFHACLPKKLHEELCKGCTDRTRNLQNVNFCARHALNPSLSLYDN